MSRVFVVALAFCGCNQTTGNALVEFSAAARGPADAVKGQPYEFDTPAGFHVMLTRAELFVGAVYLNQNNPANYTLEPACIQPGVYTGEVRSQLLVDALDPAPQPFPGRGAGTDFDTRSGELWLASGDVNADSDGAVVLAADGVAERGGTTWPFSARFTIGSNRRIPPRSPALPGSNPLCKQRIVSPIPTELTLGARGTLELSVDPKAWFTAVDFSQLTADPLDATRFAFIDGAEGAGQPDVALYNGLRASTGPYTFTWLPNSP
ncbi:MAG: hypothetical protein JNG84_00205 [Archangium sp.]|nr:hypothetical protein [Archangium sp.]